LSRTIKHVLFSRKDGTTHLLTVELDRLRPPQLNNQPISLRQEQGRKAV